MTASETLGANARQAMIDIFRNKDAAALDGYFDESFTQNDSSMVDGVVGKSLTREVASSEDGTRHS